MKQNVTDVIQINPDWLKPIGQFFELLAVICLTSLLGLFWLSSSRTSVVLGIVLISFASLVCFGLAICCSYKAAAESDTEAARVQKDADSNKHMISDARLAVLKDMAVPESVRGFLKSHMDKTLANRKEQHADGLVMTGAELVSLLNDELGPAIVREFKESILKYTLCYVAPPPPPPPNSDAINPQQAGAKTSVNSQTAQLNTGTVGV